MKKMGNVTRSTTKGRDRRAGSLVGPRRDKSRCGLSGGHVGVELFGHSLCREGGAGGTGLLKGKRKGTVLGTEGSPVTAAIRASQCPDCPWGRQTWGPCCARAHRGEQPGQRTRGLCC